MATSEEIERASLCSDLEYIAHELAQCRAASPQSVFTILRAVEWIRTSGAEKPSSVEQPK